MNQTLWVKKKHKKKRRAFHSRESKSNSERLFAFSTFLQGLRERWGEKTYGDSRERERGRRVESESVRSERVEWVLNIGMNERRWIWMMKKWEQWKQVREGAAIFSADIILLLVLPIIIITTFYFILKNAKDRSAVLFFIFNFNLVLTPISSLLLLHDVRLSRFYALHYSVF